VVYELQLHTGDFSIFGKVEIQWSLTALVGNCLCQTWFVSASLSVRFFNYALYIIVDKGTVIILASIQKYTAK